MCRVLSYLGKPILVEELLYKPDNSFVKQSYNPRMMTDLLNLAGFGLVAWDSHSYHPEIPYQYKISNLPFYDENLKNLASKIKPYCLLTHIRGVAYVGDPVISNQNVHPFIYGGTHIAFAHNGSLSNFDAIKFDLLNAIHPDYRYRIQGTTDSEYMYALFLTQLAQTKNFTHFQNSFDPHMICDALIETFKILKTIRAKHNIAITSPINLFITNGEFVAATRFVLDYGWQSSDIQSIGHMTYHSLWYTYGEHYGLYDGEYKMKDGKKKSCILIASEPLTEDTSTWIEVPAYTMIVVWRQQDEIKILSQDINL